jgi:hypothetical protein
MKSPRNLKWARQHPVLVALLVVAIGVMILIPSQYRHIKSISIGTNGAVVLKLDYQGRIRHFAHFQSDGTLKTRAVLDYRGQTFSLVRFFDANNNLLSTDWFTPERIGGSIRARITSDHSWSRGESNCVVDAWRYDGEPLFRNVLTLDEDRTHVTRQTFGPFDVPLTTSRFSAK